MFLDIQNFTESLGIIRARPLAKDSRRVSQSVRPGPGLKLQAASHKHQAPSRKLQAPSLLSHKPQASSPKHKGLSFKPQASSSKILEPGYI